MEPEDLRSFTHALREYADEMHREKEEHVLLPFLVRHGFDWEAPPLSRVYEEHSVERDLIAALDHAGMRIQRWTDEERRHVTALVRSLSELQRRHHRTENEQLFPELLARLDVAALEQLAAELARFDQQHTHIERRREATQLGDDLIVRFEAQAGP